MSGMQSARGTAPKRPRFLWRGLLIVLPALVMAGFGLVSLRQDRLLARHQAADEAGKLATELVAFVLPTALRLDVALPVTTRPQDDPVLAAWREGLLIALLDDAGVLVHPPPFRWPTPNPLELDTLPDDQRGRWEQACRALFQADDPLGAEVEFEALVGEGLPARFEALARFHLFDLALRGGQADRGLEQFERLRRLDSAFRSESGLPLRLLAEWRWLRSIGPDAIGGVDGPLDWLCARVVFEPGPISETILQYLREFDLEMWQVRRTWLHLWDAHEEARRFAEVLHPIEVGSTTGTNSSSTGWIEFENGERFVQPQPIEGGAWWVAWPEDSLTARVRQILDVMSLPAYLGCEIRIGGRTVTASAEMESVLATMSSSASRPGVTEFAATIWLADPDRLYARQRKRTWWFGSLIAVSAASVLCGAVAAWRGFRDQQRASEMKSNFVSSVSHEMRAPIASVRLMAEELVDRGVTDPGKAGEYHGYILQECRRLSALIENVLDFSRHEQGRKEYQFEPTDLVPVVDETIRVMRSYAAERNVSIERQVTGASVEAEVDAAAIQQVLVNLIDNAIKHSPPGAKVQVAVTCPHQGVGDCWGNGTPSPQPSPPVGARGQSAGARDGWLELSVRDHGPGIPIEEQRLIFERFYRRGTELRRETQGIGLGLAIVRHIAEAHGGTVRVESRSGQGSRFIVELPLKQGKEG
jgi:signal transduction histidine kinase